MPQKPRLVEDFKDYLAFTPLNMTSDQILALARDKFTVLAPMKKDPTARDRSRYCEFHLEYGHLASECHNLKRKIEALIQRGELKEFVLRMISVASPTSSRPQSSKGGGATATPDRATAAIVANPQLHVVTTILGGP